MRSFLSMVRWLQSPITSNSRSSTITKSGKGDSWVAKWGVGSLVSFANFWGNKILVDGNASVTAEIVYIPICFFKLRVCRVPALGFVFAAGASPYYWPKLAIDLATLLVLLFPSIYHCGSFSRVVVLEVKAIAAAALVGFV